MVLHHINICVYVYVYIYVYVNIFLLTLEILSSLFFRQNKTVIHIDLYFKCNVQCLCITLNHQNIPTYILN